MLESLDAAHHADCHATAGVPGAPVNAEDAPSNPQQHEAAEILTLASVGGPIRHQPPQKTRELRRRTGLGIDRFVPDDRLRAPEPRGAGGVAAYLPPLAAEKPCRPTGFPVEFGAAQGPESNWAARCGACE